MNVGAFEAKTRFSELLEKVREGQEITITKHGIAVARLVPFERAKPLARKEAIDAFKKLRKGIRLKGSSLRELIEEGRRY